MTNVEKAIKRSIGQNEIVTINYTVSDAYELGLACDDSAETDNRVEYWGTDDAGNEWRVHLAGDRDDRLAEHLRVTREVP